MNSEVKTPHLYLLPVTLSDCDPATVLPRHNIEIARSLKHFIVENVRTARRFLKKIDHSIDISTLSFEVLDKDTRPEDVARMLEPMKNGEDMGVMSEAGCPAVADPGSLAVAAALSAGYEVVPLVGPSSILLALMASGFNGQSFAFNGYLPIDEGARTQRLHELHKRIMHQDQTQIFIETPYRNNRMVEALTRTLPGNLRLCVASDLTGENQQIICKSLSQWRNDKTNISKIPAIFLLYK